MLKPVQIQIAELREDLGEILTSNFPDYQLGESQQDVSEHLYNGRGDCLGNLSFSSQQGHFWRRKKGCQEALHW